MTGRLVAKPLTGAAFAPFGDVIDPDAAPARLINQGRCRRYSDMARMDFSNGRAGISLFDADARHFPVTVDMMERHPGGSQAFLPLDQVPMLVVVAPDAGGVPGLPVAFVSAPGQGVNLLRNIWHGVLMPVARPGRYAVIDRIGPGDNLQEHWFETPFTIDTATT